MFFRLFAMMFIAVSVLAAPQHVEIRKLGLRGRVLQPVRTDRVMVKFTSPVHAREFRVLTPGRGRFKDVFEVEVSPPFTPEGFVQRLRETDDREEQAGRPRRVARVELALVSTKRGAPNDQYFSRQWYLGADQGYPLPNIGFLDLPDLSSVDHSHGEIWVGDTGHPQHEDFDNSSIVEHVKFVDDNFPGDTTDREGHGTSVFGSIGATTNNGKGIASLGFGFRFGCAQILDSDGQGTIFGVIGLLDYLTERQTTRVKTDPMAWTLLNLSAGGYGHSQILEDAKSRAKAAGIHIVAAAGNDGLNLSVDAYDWFCSDGASNVTVVASSDFADQPAIFSKDSSTNFGPTVDVFVPGVGIATLGLNNTYVTERGTSFSATFVTAIEAHMLALFAGISDKEMKQRLMNGEPFKGRYLGTEFVSNTQFSRSGIRLDVAKALSQAWTPPTTPVVLDSKSDASFLSTEVSSSGKGIYGCELLLSETEGGPFVRFGELLPNFANGVARVRAPVQKGRTYYRSVQCFDTVGNASPMSPVETVDIPISE